MHQIKVIADLGSNFNTKEDIIHAIDVASEINIFALKVQSFSEYDLTGWGSVVNSRYSCPPEWLEELQAHAHEKKIVFGCTFFSRKKFKTYNRFTDFYKIANRKSREMDLIQDINNKAERSGKQIILSVSKNIDYSDILKELNPYATKVLFCSPKYPSGVKDYPIQLMKQYDGISDHTRDMSVFNKAKAIGCEFIEKHVHCLETEGIKFKPDRVCSIELRRLKQ